MWTAPRRRHRHERNEARLTFQTDRVALVAGGGTLLLWLASKAGLPRWLFGTIAIGFLIVFAETVGRCAPRMTVASKSLSSRASAYLVLGFVVIHEVAERLIGHFGGLGYWPSFLLALVPAGLLGYGYIRVASRED